MNFRDTFKEYNIVYDAVPKKHGKDTSAYMIQLERHFQRIKESIN